MVGGEQDVVRGIEWAPDLEIAGITYQDVILRTTEGVLFCLMTRKSDGTVQPFTSPENYENSLGMADDARLVVRTSALAALLACLTEAPESRPDAVPVTDKAEAMRGVSTVERQTLLKLVLGMAMVGYKYSPNALRNTATAEIAGDLETLGLYVSNDTVLKWLKEATKAVLDPKRSKT
jgi:hypothetical protein